MDYATATHPLGPYTYRGTIIDNADCDPASWNNHGSIEEVGGRWYVFYHRSHGGSQYGRRVCVEPIEFDSDGLIAPVAMTSTGAGRPFALGEQIEAWRACAVTGTAFVTRADDPHPNTVSGGADGGEAVFRYADWEAAPCTCLGHRPAEALRIDSIGAGGANMSGKDWSTTELSVLYDVFYECGTRLGGEYVSLAYAAEDAGDAEAVEFWDEQDRALQRERDAVDSHDREAIVAAMERWEHMLTVLRYARAARPLAA